MKSFPNFSYISLCGIGEDYMDFYRILRTDDGQEVWCRLCEEIKVINGKNDKCNGKEEK